MEQACTSKPEQDEDEKSKFLRQFFIDEDFMRQEESEEDTFVDFEKRRDEAQKLKTKANDLFVGAKNFLEACQLYTDALHICPVTKFHDLRAILYSNRAATLAKMDFLDEAIEDCTKALEFDPNFLKAYFRRAHLYEEKNDLEKSMDDYKTILSKKSDDQAAKNHILEKRRDEAQILKTKANDLFVGAKNFLEACQLYTDALHICPVTKFHDLRAILYSNRAATLAKMEKRRDEAQKLKTKANDLFVGAKNFLEACQLYTDALHICPVTKFHDLRAILYSNRAATLAKMDFLDEAIEDCTKALEFDPNFLKAYFRRAQFYEEKNDLEKSMDDYKTILSKKSDDQAAKNHILRLTPIVEEKREKLKEEMMGKLKDLGNVFLRPFGLSTDNFVMEKNQNGGYSINMKK